ncbi:MAG: hypothetical protein ACRDVM_08965 [Acidimicrobiia bacterium]
METHDGDARSRQAADPDAAWRRVAEQVSALSDRFRDHYLTEDAEGPTDEAVREALRTLGEALNRVVVSLGHALGDPDVREAAKQTAGGLVTAMGAAFSELGEELRRGRDHSPPDRPQPTEA